MSGRGPVRHARPIGLVAMVAVVLTFSAGSTIVKKSGVPGPTVAFWRMLGASVIWMIMLRITEHRFVSARELRRSALAGMLIGINTTLFYTAATKTSVANLEFIGALSPLLLLPAGAMLFHEKVDRRATVFGLVSIVGLAVVLFNAPPRGVATWSGNGLAVLSLGMWCSYMLASRQLRTGMSVVALMASALPTATLMALPVTLLNHDIGQLDGRAIAYIALLTLLTGVLAHGLIVFAQRNVPIGIMSLIQVGQPALAVVWSAIFLSQAIRPLQVVGMAMVVCGLAAVVVQTQRRTARLITTEDGELAGSAG
ncbi:MAG: DMT family transporter [Ilumatobacteraceae bacterium]